MNFEGRRGGPLARLKSSRSDGIGSFIKGVFKLLLVLIFGLQSMPDPPPNLGVKGIPVLLKEICNEILLGRRLVEGLADAFNIHACSEGNLFKFLVGVTLVV